MMLSETKLVVLCVACSVLGIAALFIIASVSEPLQVSVQQASKLDVTGSGTGTNAKVKVVGFVDSVAIGPNSATLKIAELNEAEAVSFDTRYVAGLNLQRFQEVEVYGVLQNYKGRTSLIISRIKPRNNSLGISNMCPFG